MPRAFFIISILFTILLTTQVFAGGNSTFSRYLREPAVKWDNDRLTGEIKNAPVQSLIEELLRKEGFDWEAIGDLKGTISITLDHLTVEESIREIMRLSRFNYALIVDGQQPNDAKRSHLIKELTIYQGDDVIRFSRTLQKTHIPKKKNIKNNRKPRARKATAALPPKPPVKKTQSHKSTAALPPEPPVKKIKARKAASAPPTKEELLDLDREMKAFADEMLAEEKITTEEYNELMKEIEDGKK